MRAHFLVGAPHSGSGKTTVTLGLLRAFRQQGLRVQPFKCGPDFIDPIHHRSAAGHNSINLDGYMMSPDHIRDLYTRHTAGADVAITEGVMGLFDGSRKSEGSSAGLANLLELPVILVLNAKAMAYSAAALLYGLRNFDPRLRIAGVIFNFVDTASHYRLLQEACEDAGVKALGHLPVNPALRIPSRHLGLDTADAGEAIAAAADHLTRHIDLSAVLEATQMSISENTPPPGPESTPEAESKAPPENAPASRTILIAHDAAFHFLYPENIRRLEQWGRVQYFSPLHDTHLPPADLIYLPGGYPELYAQTLSDNHSMLQALRRFSGKIIAECGGLMYLGRTITDDTGRAWPMTGLLDIATSLFPKKLTLGYRTAQVAGHSLKGHEFHYSLLVDPPAASPIVVYNSRGHAVNTPIFHEPRLLAGYMHFYWGEDPAWLYQWLDE